MAERLDEKERPQGQRLVYVLSDGERLWMESLGEEDELVQFFQLKADELQKEQRALRGNTPLKRKSGGRGLSTREQKDARVGRDMRLNRLQVEVEALTRQRILPIKVIRHADGTPLDCIVGEFDRFDHHWYHFAVEHFDILANLSPQENKLVSNFFEARFNMKHGDTADIRLIGSEQRELVSERLDAFYTDHPESENTLPEVFREISKIL